MWFSCHKKIEKKITDMPEGSVFVPGDFADIAVDDTASKVLTRLSYGDLVKRLFRGVYWRPKKDRKNAPQDPDPNQVANALARSNGQRVIPCGDTALHILGLTDKKPEEWTYITDGDNRKYSYKNIIIKFKHATGKLYKSMSDKTSLVVQAIKAYGKEAISKDVLRNIRSKLTREELSKLLEETKNTTSWIYQTVKQLCMMPASDI